MTHALPSLTGLTVFDERLREVARAPEAVEHALGRARTALASTSSPAQRIRLLGYVGNAERILGRALEATETHGEAVALATAAGELRLHAISLINLGEAHRCAENPNAAERILRRALDLSSPGGVATDVRDYALQHLGKCLLDQGRLEDAVTVLEEALALRESKGDAQLIASTRLALDRARAT